MGEHLVAIAKRLAVLVCLPSALALAGSWSGFLVDSKCYDSEERNVNPTDTLTSVDRDKDYEIRYCSPGAKTKSFAIVQLDGISLKLDSAGNAKAAELVPKTRTGKRSRLFVAITGDLSKNTITVDTIAVAPPR